MRRNHPKTGLRALPVAAIELLIYREPPAVQYVVRDFYKGMSLTEIATETGLARLTVYHICQNMRRRAYCRQLQQQTAIPCLN